jgi:hypothetical protein
MPDDCSPANLNIALVRQDCLQDLWICGQKPSVAQALASTQLRAGPLGLFDILNADYYIVKSDKYFNRGFESTQARTTARLREELAGGGALPGFKAVDGLSIPTNADFSVSPFEIDWQTYDIVFCINDALPKSIREKCDQTVFICIPGEGNVPRSFAGYHALTTHNVAKSPVQCGLLMDIPYSFMGPATLQDALASLGIQPGQRDKHPRVYLEINMFNKRPPSIDEQAGLAEWLTCLGYSASLHRDFIIENLSELQRCTVFLKQSGRPIRGNSVIEAISVGCPVLLDPRLLVDSIPLPADSFFLGSESLACALLRLRDDPAYRKDLLMRQRQAVAQFVVSYSLLQIKWVREYCLGSRLGQASHKPGIKISRLATSLKRDFGLYCYKRGLGLRNEGRLWT